MSSSFNAPANGQAHWLPEPTAMRYCNGGQDHAEEGRKPEGDHVLSNAERQAHIAAAA